MGTEKKNESGIFGNYFLKLVFIALSCLVSIVGYFITDKLKQIERKLEKIDQLEQKVQALNKSQIQIMTHLKIPIPDYLYTSVIYQNSVPTKSNDIPDREAIIFQYYIAADNKYRFIKNRRL